MQVLREVRQRDMSDVAPNPVPHRPGDTGDDFLMMLQEENRRSIPPVRDAADTASDSSATEASPGDSPEATEATTAPDSSRDTSGAQDDSSGSDRAEAAARAENDNDAATETDATQAEGDDAEEMAAMMVAGLGDPATLAPVTSRATVQATAGGMASEILPPATAPATNAAPTPDTAALYLSVAVETAEEGAPADGTPEIPSGQAPFPKTLNALLAEGALRTTGPTADNAADGQADLSRTTGEILPQALGDDAPETPLPLPQAPALESGGVRLEMPSLPRVPLSNLPGELAQQIQHMQQEGAKTMRIRIVPENLGEVQIEIRGHGDTLRVHMTSANAGVRDALNSQMNDLKNALQEHGLSLDNVTVGGEPERRGAPLDRDHSNGTGRRPALHIESIEALTAEYRRPLTFTPGALNILT